jgi:hypothetical protein
MFKERKAVRYSSLATAQLPGIFDGEVLLKDISITGCRLESTIIVDLLPNSRCTMKVLPEPIAKIKNFDLVVECRWVKSGNYSCEFGFSIVESPKGKFFQRYVDYLSYHSQQV